MKKDYLKLIVLFVLICFVFCLSFYSYRNYAYADALTLSAIGGISYALMSDWGISLSSVNNNSTSVSNFMSGQLTDYVNSHGGSIATLFGSEIARIELGKLVVGYQLYNGVKDFIGWMTEQFNFGNEDSLLYAQTNDSTVIGNKVQGITGSIQPDAQIGLGAAFWNITQQGDKTLYRNIGAYSDQTYIFTGNLSGYNTYTGNYYFKVSNNQLVVCAECFNYRTLQEWTNNYVLNGIVSLGNLNWNGENYIEPTVLNPTQGWEGQIGGADWPDTNLDEMIGQIYEDVADNNLDVEGDIVEPVPVPTPVPTPVIDVIDGINTQIGQLSQIDSAISDVATEVNALEGTITDALEVPRDSEAEDFKFDLSTLFPFCIPFDIARMLRAFDGAAAAPHFQIPIQINSIGFSYIMDLDFQMFDPVAAVLRQVELIVFAVALAYATSKVIRW